MHTRTLHAEFPTTGQPLRVTLIDDEPWFAVADVCRILGRTDPTQAVKLLGEEEVRVVNAHTLTMGTHQTPGHRGFSRSNPDLDVVSESGLHRLIMRSDKPTARPFQDWLTRELLPSIRHGDTDPAREHTAETFAEVLHLDTVPDPEPVSAFELLGQTFQLYSDGFVHCPHGAMNPVFPAPDEDGGPPYGPHFRCTRTERVGLVGSRVHRLCPPVRLTDLARACHRRPAAPPGSVLLISGAPTDVLTVLNGVR
ncbi:BRO-N domain-containing protein [Streptacidiphilus neutrinimicus]|uniref:BRO-N domain-containing protein n=1 Tax=Streptacidiphilus neutrinimicus TaxID=105420 RepID=UPI000693372D|nr:Bro-N domain-containing protein [Streptacidiphilus neutrinimicus]